MPRIATFTAPEKELRPSATGASALELAGRRINSLYQEIARNTREEGQAEAQKYKYEAWPYDIAKLYDERAARQQEAANAAVRSAGRGSSGGGGGTGQVSRGAGALGRAVSDGGYGLADATNTTGSVEYANSNGTSGQLSYALPKGYQDALDKYNAGLSTAADTAAYATEAYWQQYGLQGIPTDVTSFDTSGGLVHGNAYAGGMDSSGNTGASADIPSSWWSGLTSYMGTGGSSDTSTDTNTD